MSIWFRSDFNEYIKSIGNGNMIEHLGIEIEEIGDDFIKGKMPVDHRTVQPAGLLHGGASVVLAESLGSLGANMVVDWNTHYCVGLDINANHVKSVKTGFVFGIAKPLHLGKRSQVWSIDIINETGDRVCISRLTMAVIAK